MADIIFYDGNLGSPQEVEGSGQIHVDQVTTTTVITRKYAVWTKNYIAPIPGFISFVDPQYPAAYFVDEKIERITNGVTFFTRVFCNLPPGRIEQRLISFTYPGLSGFSPSALSGQPIAWSPYGKAPPKTRLVSAQVVFSYAAVPNNTVDPTGLFPNFANVQPSSITYNGKLVDFTGDVYVRSGTAYLGGNKAESQWVIQGTTSPASYSTVVPWIVSAGLRRYMGPIWELEVVQFLAGLPY